METYHATAGGPTKDQGMERSECSSQLLAILADKVFQGVRLALVCYIKAESYLSLAYFHQKSRMKRWHLIVCSSTLFHLWNILLVGYYFPE